MIMIRKKTIKTLCLAVLVSIMVTVPVPGMSESTSRYLNVLDVRTYPDRIVVQVNDDVISHCAYPRTLEMERDTSESYDQSVSRFLSAYKSGRGGIRAIYQGCVNNNAGGDGGQVLVLDWLIDAENRTP